MNNIDSILERATERRQVDRDALASEYALIIRLKNPTEDEQARLADLMEALGIDDTNVRSDIAAVSNHAHKLSEAQAFAVQGEQYEAAVQEVIRLTAEAEKARAALAEAKNRSASFHTSKQGAFLTTGEAHRIAEHAPRAFPPDWQDRAAEAEERNAQDSN